MFEKAWQPAMESGRARSSGFGFPGYGWCFPKATRSSRGRGDHGARKTLEPTSDLPKDMCVFELLATVAGQLLQEQDKTALTARSLIELEAPKPNVDGGALEGSIACEGASYQTESRNMDVDEPGSLVHTSKVLSEPSALSCLNDLEPSILQEQKISQPIKAYFSRKKENSQMSSSQARAMGNSKTVRKLSQLDTIDTSNMVGNEGEQNCLPPTYTRQCQGLDLLLGGPLQLDPESPPLVSSASSEEITPSHMEVQSYSTIAFNESSTQEVRVKEGFSTWKAREDDGNSSESIARQTFPTKSSSASNVRVVKTRRSSNGLSKKFRGTGVGSKQKQHDFEGGEVKEDVPNLNGKRRKIKEKPSLKDEKAFIPASEALSPPDAMESNVKVSIKSFMVPELMVDLPESATIANLKKAVMDAAVSLLGGGLCVRVLLEGKRVTNEMESLLQAGISCGARDTDLLGFMLEPNPMPPTAVAAIDKDTFMLHSSNSQGLKHQTSLRFPADMCEGMLEIDANSSGIERQSTTGNSSKGDMPAQDSDGMAVPGSCDLILHSGQALATAGSNSSAVVPFAQSPGIAGVNKRRMRQPFSVVEVEVLVQAVEELGTGRWRDVKLHAFPQSKHRTYVDLKDKWKTLVHTASIAPHQRRGEPVPQGLLDRVIQAHTHWTAQQAKQQAMEMNGMC